MNSKLRSQSLGTFLTLSLISLRGYLNQQAMEKSEDAFQRAKKIADVEVLSQQVDVRLSQTSTNFSERLQRITERQEQIWELFEGVAWL